MDSTGHSLSSVERYNLSNGRVSIEASMISPRSGVGVAVLDGKLYAVGEYCQMVSFGGRYNFIRTQIIKLKSL